MTHDERLETRLRKDHVMAGAIPFATREVRWFFEATAKQHKFLKHWFEEVAPVSKQPDVGPPVWKGRLGDQPDVYLLLPGSEDMGIKWREDQLQIKGRVCTASSRVFCGRHRGNVERWIKWSFADMPSAYKQLFLTGGESGLLTASVEKTRALRKVRLDTITGEPQEIDSNSLMERGMGFELTHLQVAGQVWCSLAFEAFPDDSAMDADFTGVVEIFLSGLTEIDLDLEHSLSYPAWLRLIGEC